MTGKNDKNSVEIINLEKNKDDDYIKNIFYNYKKELIILFCVIGICFYLSITNDSPNKKTSSVKGNASKTSKNDTTFLKNNLKKNIENDSNIDLSDHEKSLKVKQENFDNKNFQKKNKKVKFNSSAFNDEKVKKENQDNDESFDNDHLKKTNKSKSYMKEYSEEFENNIKKKLKKIDEYITIINMVLYGEKQFELLKKENIEISEDLPKGIYNLNLNIDDLIKCNESYKFLKSLMHIQKENFFNEFCNWKIGLMKKIIEDVKISKKNLSKKRNEEIHKKCENYIKTYIPDLEKMLEQEKRRMIEDIEELIKNEKK